MFNKKCLIIVSSLVLGIVMTPVHAILIGVNGDPSSMGFAAEIIAAPINALNDDAFNTHMQGFNEAQNVVTSIDYDIDDGGVIAAGTRVNSHMIFLNSEGNVGLRHYNVDWLFDGLILGIMSDGPGLLEMLSTSELGNSGTTYESFANRGLDNRDGVSGPLPNDGYVIAGNQLTVGMSVNEPGDWIRVVTAASVTTGSVPAPSIILILASGLVLVGFASRKAQTDY